MCCKMTRADQNSFKQKKIDNEKTSAPKAVDRGAACDSAGRTAIEKTMKVFGLNPFFLLIMYLTAAQLELPLSFSFCRTDIKASGCFFKRK